MKILIALLIAVPIIIGVVACDANHDSVKSRFVGHDYRLFEGTASWSLAQAVKRQDEEEIAKLALANPQLVDLQEPTYGNTLLMLTVINRQLSSCQALLRAGANSNLPDTYDGSSAFLDACGIDDNVPFIQLLVEHGANVNAVEAGARRDGNYQRNTPLIKAAGTSLSNVRYLVQAGAQVNYSNEFGSTALSHALLLDKYAIALFLLENGADYKRPVVLRDEAPVSLLAYLREKVLPLDSSEYQLKMQIVAFLKKEGLDYGTEPIPEFVVKEVQESYPENWQDYLKRY